jgi:hypothetical protein
MEPSLRAIFGFLRSRRSKSGETFRTSLFFEIADGVEIDGPSIIAALELAVRRGLMRQVQAATRTYQLTDAGFDLMHELPLNFGYAPLQATSVLPAASNQEPAN